MVEGQESVSWSQWQAIAAACEEHHVPALFRSDHYLPLDEPHRGSVLDAWGTVCGLAATTTGLRLGTLVSPATFRHPSLLAKLAVTADHISNGRVEIGLGAGWHEGEHRAYGFPFPPTGQRLDRLAEQLEIVRGLWSGEAFSFAGTHYALEGVAAEPRPVQSRMPLILGGSGGARSAALAARFADEYNTTFATPAVARDRRGVVARAWEAAGRDPADFRFSVMTGFAVGCDRGEAAARAARIGERIREPAFAPPESWVHGSVDEAAVQLRQLAAAGVDRVMLQVLLHEELDQIELIGRDLPRRL